MSDLLGIFLKEFLRAPRTFLRHGSEARRRADREECEAVLREEEQRAAAELQRAFVLHRREAGTVNGASASAEVRPADDSNLVQRIIDAYVKALVVDGGPGDSQWAVFLEQLNMAVHKALTSGDVDLVSQKLRNPSTNNIFYGFDNIREDYTRQWKEDSDARDFFTRQIYDALARLAEALGAIPLENPETYGFRDPQPYPVDDLLSRLDEALGIFVTFPNPYPDECGLATERGTASFRAIQSLYQAWRITQVLDEHGGTSVVEIGAGLGRTAYYAAKLGVKRYSIVDLPFTLMSSSYFLGRVLGDAGVALFGEERAGRWLDLTIPSDFLDRDEPVDLVVNFDSFTEIGRAMADRYWNHVFDVSSVFLSMNHEANPFTVRDFYQVTPGRYRVSRHPCWMRRGYVEELIELR